MHTSDNPGDTSAASLSNSLTSHNVATAPAAPRETIEELLQRVLKIQEEYADHPVHSYEEFVGLISDWYGLVASATTDLRLSLRIALADLPILRTR